MVVPFLQGSSTTSAKGKGMEIDSLYAIYAHGGGGAHYIPTTADMVGSSWGLFWHNATPRPGQTGTVSHLSAAPAMQNVGCALQCTVSTGIGNRPPPAYRMSIRLHRPAFGMMNLKDSWNGDSARSALSAPAADDVHYTTEEACMYSTYR